MGSEPVRVKGHLKAETMIQQDSVPDRTKLIVLVAALCIAGLAAWGAGAGHSHQRAPSLFEVPNY